jgi:L-ribulose-5-phosphate 3-epimerase
MTSRPLGINTYGYIWSTPLADCLRRLAELGYREFEPVINPPHLALDEGDRAWRRRLASAMRADGIVVRSVNLPSLDANLASSMRRMRDYSVGVFRAAIELAADLGASNLITVPGRVNPLLAPPMAQRIAWMRESLEQLIPHAEAHGISLALENVPFASFPDADSLLTFVRGMASPTLSICYDVANAHFIGESPAAGLRLVRDLLNVVHCSDTTRSAWRHAEVGAGDVPFAEVHAALDEIGFQGPCMLEIIDTRPEEAILRSHRALAGFGFAPCPTEFPA